MARGNILRIALIVLAGGPLAACDRYVDRRDQVTFGHGDSIAANKAAQIIDPWPTAARTIDHGISGEQAEAAMEKLRRRTSGKEGGATPPTLSLVAAPTPAQQ
jgi:hypothetical protein